MRETLPVELTYSELEPVLTLPELKVSVPPAVASTPLSETPLALLIVSALNVVAFEPPIVCALVPLKVKVLVPAVNVPLLLKLPLTPWP